MHLKSISILFVFLFSCCSVFAQEESDIIILESHKEISFELNKNNALFTKVKVSQTFVNKSSLRQQLSRGIFFDNYSEVKKILATTDRDRQRIKPIISDYEVDGIFHSDLKIAFFDYFLDEIGEEVTITYEKIFRDSKFISAFYFNDPFPIESSKVSIEVPAWLNLNIHELNFDKQNPQKSLIQKDKSVYYEYTLNDINGLNEVDNRPSNSKLDAHLILIPGSIFIDGKEIRMVKDVSDMYQWYRKLVNKMENSTDELQSTVDELTSHCTTDSCKLYSIYRWVQKNIRYIAFEDGIMGFQPENCQKVYASKYGDCKGMANLTKEMLKIAGFDARLTWIGTRDIPYTYDIPSLNVDNHMICAIVDNDSIVFIDPTEKFSDPFHTAYRISGKEAIVEEGDSFRIVTTPKYDLNANKLYNTIDFTINDDEELNGEGKIKLTGDKKTAILNILSTVAKKDKSDVLNFYLSNSDNSYKIDLSEEDNNNLNSKSYELEYSIGIDNRIIDLGDEVYLNMEVDFFFYNNLIEERSEPFEYNTTKNIEQILTLEIPENWTLSYMPEPFQAESDAFMFDLKYEVRDDRIIYTKNIQLRDVIIMTDEFDSWNSAINSLNTFYDDQLIFTIQ